MLRTTPKVIPLIAGLEMQLDNYRSTHPKYVLAGESKRLARLRYVRSVFVPLLGGPDVRVLDAGCGDGVLLEAAREAGLVEAVGIDISPHQVAECVSRGLTRVLCEDIWTFLCRDDAGAFDVVVMRDVLEHIERDKVVTLLSLARSRLLPGGRLVLQVPNAGSPFFGQTRYGDITHELAFTASSLTQVLLAAGFSEVTVCGDPMPAMDVRTTVRRLVWFPCSFILRVMRFAVGGAYRGPLTQNLLAIGKA